MKHKSQFGKWFAAVLLLALMGLTALALWPEQDVSAPKFSSGSAQIVKANGEAAHFKVEIAETPEQQAYGLMFRQAVPAGTGMIFPQETGKEVVFWMKNTLVSLDLIFADKSGRIVKIAEQAVPLDLRPISADLPVATVLEIGGGEAKKQGISLGDRLIWQKSE